jgi:hypothetical protein
MRSLSVAISSLTFLTVLFAGILQAQNREATLAALMKLPAAERHARLVEGAKKESGLVWYSSTTAEDALALTKKFHEQHPSIQVQHFRSSSEKTARTDSCRVSGQRFQGRHCRSAGARVVDHDQAETLGSI